MDTTSNSLWRSIGDIEISAGQLESVYRMLLNLSGELVSDAEDVGEDPVKAMCFCGRAYDFADMIVTAVSFMKHYLDELSEHINTGYEQVRALKD